MAQLKDIEDVVSHTCKTCRFWDTDPMEDKHMWGDCSNKKFVHALVPWKPNQLAFVGETSFDFCTGPDFGCVHWEAK